MPKRFPLKRIIRGYEPLEDPRISGLLTAQNVRMHLGAIEKRDGLQKFGSQATSDPVIHVATAQYSNGQDLLRFQADKIHRYNSGSWTDVTPASETISTTQWTSTMLYEIFYCSPGNVFNAVNNRGIIKQTSLAGALSGVDDSPGAGFLIGYAGRLFALNVVDIAGVVRPYRVMWTAVGDFDDWTSASLGAGDIDLSTNGYPVQAGVVTAGRLIILKGDATGGSIVMCTSTYDAVIPLAFEPIYGGGILGRNTLVSAGVDFTMYLGHDHFYAISSGRVVPIEHPVAEEAVSRINPDRHAEGFAYYTSVNGDVRFVIPVGSSDLESYTFNVRTKAWAGPEDTTPKLVSGSRYILTDVTPWSGASGSWSANAGKSWKSMSPSGGPAHIVLGSSDGWVYEETVGYYGDAGSEISTIIETGDYDFEGERIRIPGQRYPREIESGDELGIDGLYIEYKGSWSPKIEISNDGGSAWTEIYNGTLSGSDAHAAKLITFDEIVGTRFRVRITHTSASEAFRLIAMKLNVSWRRRAFEA